MCQIKIAGNFSCIIVSLECQYQYTANDVIVMLKNDKDFWGANIYVFTIDNLSRNQLESEGESTVLRGPNKRERIGGYEQPEVTSEDTSENTTASADADVTSSAASLVVT